MSYPSGDPVGDSLESSPLGAEDNLERATRCPHRTADDPGTELQGALRRCTERVHLVRRSRERETRRIRDDPAQCRASVLPASRVALVSDGGRPRFTAREGDTGLLVVADLRGVVRDDRETEVDLADDSLILTVDDRFVWRVPVEYDRPTITDISLNNDILEARVQSQLQ